MTDLKDILYKVNIVEVSGFSSHVINSIEFDSRKAKEGTVFVAIKGVNVDGHDYISKAIDMGCRVIVCQYCQIKYWMEFIISK